MNRILAAVLTLCFGAPLAAEERVPTMTLTGVGTVQAEPDEGYISVAFVNVAPTSAKAVKDNAVVMRDIYNSLADLDIEKRDIQTTQFSVQQNYKTVWLEKKDRNGNPISKQVPDGFRVVNSVRVTVCELDKFGEVLDVVTANGANNINRISFGSSKAADYLEEARIEASRNVRKKAILYSQHLAFTIGQILNVSESLNRQMPVYKSAMRDIEVGGTPVSGGSLTFSASVTVTWQLDKP